MKQKKNDLNKNTKNKTNYWLPSHAIALNVTIPESHIRNENCELN